MPPTFRRLAWSNLAAQSAEQLGLAAAPLVAVLMLGAGAGETGLLQTAQTLPFLLLSIPAGLLADRTSRRRLMASAETLRALSLVAILVLILTAHLSIPLLAFLGFIGAAGTVAYSVAAPSLVPALVPRPLLGAANSTLELARSAAFAAGPALGGALVGYTGAPTAFATAAALSITAAILLARLPEPTRPALPKRHPLHDLREGARFIRAHTLLRPILLTSVVFNTSWFLLQAIYVPYAAHSLHLGAPAIGFTLGAYGIGMVSGALAAPRLTRRLAYGAMLTIGPTTALAGALLMAATLWFPSAPLAAISFFLFGAGPILWAITTTTLRQAVTPDALLGRVSALLLTAGFGARPIGAALGALIGHTLGAPACILVAAAGFLLQFALIVRSPVPSLEALPAAV